MSRIVARGVPVPVAFRPAIRPAPTARSPMRRDRGPLATGQRAPGATPTTDCTLAWVDHLLWTAGERQRVGPTGILRSWPAFCVKWDEHNARQRIQQEWEATMPRAAMPRAAMPPARVVRHDATIVAMENNARATLLLAFVRERPKAPPGLRAYSWVLFDGEVLNWVQSLLGDRGGPRPPPVSTPPRDFGAQRRCWEHKENRERTACMRREVAARRRLCALQEELVRGVHEVAERTARWDWITAWMRGRAEPQPRFMRLLLGQRHAPVAAAVRRRRHNHTAAAAARFGGRAHAPAVRLAVARRMVRGV